MNRLCVIRGIRYHPGFVQELHGIRDEFTRAINARRIMSNIILDINQDKPEEVPYCIWHPEVASEDTYRKLVRQYPQMAYHVGRACAVAGYTHLYKELDILPDVHIAEEARESGNMEIYTAIVESPVKYSVMNDYERTLNIETPQPAHLNGDTPVLAFLDVKQEVWAPQAYSDFSDDEDLDDDDLDVDEELIFFGGGYRKRTFNITEDMGVGEYSSQRIFWNSRRRTCRRDDQRRCYSSIFASPRRPAHCQQGPADFDGSILWRH